MSRSTQTRSSLVRSRRPTRGYNPDLLGEKENKLLELIDKKTKAKTNQEKRRISEEISTFDCSRCNLDGMTLSQRNLSGINFGGANLNNINFHGSNTNLERCNFTVSNFSKNSVDRANMSNTVWEAAKISECIFEDVDLDSAWFNDTNISKTIIENCNFDSVNMTNTVFDDNCEIINPKFTTDCTIFNVSFDFSSIYDLDLNTIDLQGEVQVLTFTNCNIFKLNAGNRSPWQGTLNPPPLPPSRVISNIEVKDCKLKGCKINNVDLAINFVSSDRPIGAPLDFYNYFINCSLGKVLFLNNYREKSINYEKLNFQESCTLDEIKVNNCSMKYLTIDDSTLKCSVFNEVDLSEFEALDSRIWNTSFFRCNFENGYFSKIEYYDTLDTGRARHCPDIGNTNFKECNLTNCYFQSSYESINKVSFEGSNLTNANLKGCNLRGVNFKNCNLTFTSFEFSDVTGADFRGATFNNTILIGVAIGWMEALNIPRDAARSQVRDTHLVFNKIKFNDLFEFYRLNIDDFRNKEENFSRLFDVRGQSSQESNTAIFNFIVDNLTSIIENSTLSTEDKTRLKDKLNNCKNSIKDWDYKSLLPNTSLSWGKLIFQTINFINQQSLEFKNLYIESLIDSIINAHGQGAISCSKGMLERIISTIYDTAIIINQMEGEEKLELEKVIKIIIPPLSMQELHKEWMKIHEEGGPEEFKEPDEDDEEYEVKKDEIMESFKEYASIQLSRDLFNKEYTELTEEEKEIILEKVLYDNEGEQSAPRGQDPKDYNYGVIERRKQLGIQDFFGGKKNKKRKTRKKVKKVKIVKIGKTRCKKRKNTCKKKKTRKVKIVKIGKIGKTRKSRYKIKKTTGKRSIKN